MFWGVLLHTEGHPDPDQFVGIQPTTRDAEAHNLATAPNGLLYISTICSKTKRVLLIGIPITTQIVT